MAGQDRVDFADRPNWNLVIPFVKPRITRKASLRHAPYAVPTLSTLVLLYSQSVCLRTRTARYSY